MHKLLCVYASCMCMVNPFKAYIASCKVSISKAALYIAICTYRTRTRRLATVLHLYEYQDGTGNQLIQSKLYIYNDTTS